MRRLLPCSGASAVLLVATFILLVAPGPATADTPATPLPVGDGAGIGLSLDDLDPAKVALMSQYQRREVFREANALYYSEAFAEAARLYSLLIEAGIEQAPLYYNAGNALYKSGQIGPAVWHYEKARRLTPRDERLLANLREISPPENLPQPFVLLRPFVTVARSVSLSEALLLAGVAWWVGLMLLALVALAPDALGPWRNRMRTLAWGVLMMFIVLTGLAGGKWWNQAHRPWAIIVADAVTGYAAPREDGPPQFQDPLPPGWRVQVLQDLAGGWSEIRLPDGVRTYVRTRQVRRL